ncbi:MAG: ArgR family transcriptional regulator [Bacteroidales bacterium]|jgi:transcriptional regulator of arginine metabolism|nr:ArgR family transcriptional regulator [Bacteroidales bacterium]
MQKTKRLLAIEKIIAGENISSHEILLKKLKGKGISCTQATLSRNLRQIGAGRIPDGKGGYKYSLPESTRNSPSTTGKLQVLPVILNLIDAKGLLVIRTLPGNASSTAVYIDNTLRYEIAGTIAGDDTILVIPREGINNQQLHSCLEIILPGLHEQIRKNG